MYARDSIHPSRSPTDLTADAPSPPLEPVPDSTMPSEQMPDASLSNSFSGWSRPFDDHPFSPVMEVLETDTSIEIVLETPGMETDDFEIEAADGVLTIRGNKRSEPDDRPKTYRITERVYGAFERVVALPQGVDPTGIAASLVNGVLTISIPKPVHGDRKEIPIAAR